MKLGLCPLICTNPTPNLSICSRKMWMAPHLSCIDLIDDFLEKTTFLDSAMSMPNAIPSPRLIDQCVGNVLPFCNLIVYHHVIHRDPTLEGRCGCAMQLYTIFPRYLCQSLEKWVHKRVVVKSFGSRLPLMMSNDSWAVPKK